MTTSNQLDSFLRTGKHPATAKETSAVLDLLRSRILTNNETKPMTTKPTPTITASMTAEFMTWKKKNPHGTAQQFIAHKTKPSPTIAAHAGALDPNTVPRMATGKIDSLALTNQALRAQAEELKAASASIQQKRGFKRTVINRSKYHKPD